MDDRVQDPSTQTEPATVTDWLVRAMNLSMFLLQPRKGSNFRWANTARDALSFVGEFAEDQHTKIYGRITSRYKYHKQQQFENSVRKFDVTEALAAQMAQFGNAAFYQSVCGLAGPGSASYPADLIKLSEISSIKASAEYLFREVFDRSGQAAASAAQISYVRGFSRPVRTMDFDDWERLRNELRTYRREGGVADHRIEEDVALIAISYKGKDVKITRRMLLLKKDGTPDEEEGVLKQITVQMTDDFLDDFRWSQLVRSCIAIARRDGKAYARLWVDRFVMMGIEKEERDHIYKVTQWEEFGLFPYAVCEVVRLYDMHEPYYGTDFWRKLETVLGVAGKGLVLDDYMLRKFDHTIFFGPKVYQRLGDGLCRIGGGGTYVRSTTLALATAVLTDGVSVSEANEDLRTKAAAGAWKAWALRTITEGAYSKGHPSMMIQQEAVTLRYREFVITAFWESMVSRSYALTGNSYLDMSFQRSMQWRKSSKWDGVIEWAGMMSRSCNIEEKDLIMQFLARQTEVRLWTSTTGHVASIITLTSSDVQDKRTLVVNLSRFSTARRGHVTAVAEATGLWQKKVLPFYLIHSPDPDGDQTAEIGEEGVLFDYKNMKVEFAFMPMLKNIALLVGNIILIVFTFGLWIPLAIIQLGFLFKPWPWVDRCDVGEGVFDNLLLHSLYGSGIKTQYRRLRGAPFDQLGWT